MLLAFKMEEGAMKQGRHVDLEAIKDTEMDFFSELLERT